MSNLISVSIGAVIGIVIGNIIGNYICEKWIAHRL